MSTDASIFEKIRDWPLAALFEINLLDQMLLECGVLHAATCGRYRNAIIDFIKSACRVMSYDFDSIPVRSFPWAAVKVRAYDKVWFVNPQKAGTAVMLLRGLPTSVVGTRDPLLSDPTLPYHPRI